MIDLPTKVRLDRLDQLADWVEVCALAAEAGTVSQAEVADVVHDAGLLGGAPGELFAGEADFRSEDDMSEDDPLQSFSEEVWAVLARRTHLLGERYALEVDGELVTVRGGSWRAAPCFAALTLLANIAQYPLAIELAEVEGIRFSHLFEKIVQASGRGLFQGTTARFGVPQDPGWPTPIDDRIRHLGSLMRLRVEDLEDKTHPLDGDKTLDVVSRLSYGDDGPGSVIVMAQCATGRHWQDKRAEPVLALWEDVLRWDAVLVRALAVPWWLGDEREYARQFRHFNKAIILDRPRLLAGRPEDHFDPDYRVLLESWCEGQLERLPQLA